MRFIDVQGLKQVFFAPLDSPRLVFQEDSDRLGTVIRGHEIGHLELTHPNEFQDIKVSRSSQEIEECGFSPDGSFLAAGFAGQIRLLGTEQGFALTDLPVERLPVFAFPPSRDAVLTSDSKGISRWPIQ